MELITVEETAQILKVKETTIRNWLRTGKLRGTKISEIAWRIDKTDLDNFISSGTNQQNTQDNNGC